MDGLKKDLKRLWGKNTAQIFDTKNRVSIGPQRELILHLA